MHNYIDIEILEEDSFIPAGENKVEDLIRIKEETIEYESSEEIKFEAFFENEDDDSYFFERISYKKTTLKRVSNISE